MTNTRAAGPPGVGTGTRVSAQSGFTPNSEVVVRELPGDKEWEVRSTIEYQCPAGRFVVPYKMHTDFASVPRPFVWLIPRYGRYTKSAILHDHLCRSRPVPRLEVDAIFRDSMGEEDVAFLRRWFMWAAVRLGAMFGKPYDRVGWYKAIFQVFLLFLLAIPVVLLPSILIMLGLALFWLEELICYGVLMIRDRLSHGPPTTINRPRIRLTL
jgi:hypothetical protein